MFYKDIQNEQYSPKCHTKRLLTSSFLNVEKRLSAQWMPDSSGKPGEAMQHGSVPDLERIAGTEVDESIVADSP